MRPPFQLRVALRPSRIATLALAMLAALAVLLLLIMPAPAWTDALGALVLIGWAAHRIRLHGLRCAPSSIIEVMLSEDRTIVVRRRDGGLRAGVVLDNSHVHAAFTSIVWRPVGARLARSLPLVPDMLEADDFRRLRVLLRYGRREDSAGASASQA
jgi:toxin CptA